MLILFSLSFFSATLALVGLSSMLLKYSCCWNIRGDERIIFTFTVVVFVVVVVVIALLYCQNISHNVNKLQQDVYSRHTVTVIVVAFCFASVLGWCGTVLKLRKYTRTLIPEKWEIMCFQWFSRKIWLLLFPAVAWSVYSRIKLNRVYHRDGFIHFSLYPKMCVTDIDDGKWIKLPVWFEVHGENTFTICHSNGILLLNERVFQL